MRVERSDEQQWLRLYKGFAKISHRTLRVIRSKLQEQYKSTASGQPHSSPPTP